MPADRAFRDQNRVETLIAASTTDDLTPVSLEADPATHRLLVTGTITGSPTVNLQDGLGNPITSVAGQLSVTSAAAGHGTVTGTIASAAGPSSSLSVDGFSGAGVLLTGTLSGGPSVKPEVSMDGGTTWVQTFFQSPTTRAVTATVTAIGSYSIVLPGGATHARINYTAGTGTLTYTLTSTTGPTHAETVTTDQTTHGTTDLVASDLTKVAGSAVATAASGIQKVGVTDGSGNAISSVANALSVNVASATNIVTGPGYNAPALGTLTGAGSVTMACQQYSTIAVELYGTYAGAVLVFEQQFDTPSGNWYPIFGQPVTSTQSTQATGVSPATNESRAYQFTVGTAINFRVRATALSSGTLNVFMAETTDNLQYGQNITVLGGINSGATDSGAPIKVGGVFVTTQPTVGNGARVDSQFTARGGLIVATGVDTFNVTASQATGTNLHTVVDSGTITTVSTVTAVTGITNALPAGTNAIGSVNLAPTASGGWSVYFANAIKTTVTISGSAGKLAACSLINIDSAPVYLQVFDTTGAVTLGTTVPSTVIPYPANSTAANGIADRWGSDVGAAIANGIKAAATTTATGASTSTNGLTGMILYK